MSLFKRTTTQGEILVQRDEDSRVVARGTPLPPTAPKKMSARAQLRTLSNNCLDYYAVLDNIARGVPFKAKLPDGREGEWVVPTIAEMKDAALSLVEFLDGKAVPQTEVTRADKEDEDRDQLQAMSDADLLEVVSRRTLKEGK